MEFISRSDFSLQQATPPSSDPAHVLHAGASVMTCWKIAWKDMEYTLSTFLLWSSYPKRGRESLLNPLGGYNEGVWKEVPTKDQGQKHSPPAVLTETSTTWLKQRFCLLPQLAEFRGASVFQSGVPKSRPAPGVTDQFTHYGGKSISISEATHFVSTRPSTVTFHPYTPNFPSENTGSIYVRSDNYPTVRGLVERSCDNPANQMEPSSKSFLSSRV